MNESPHESGHAPAYRITTVLLSVLLAMVSLLYIVCLFKHISYPLMWADESMTAVGAQRVLEYGYPKVHDGRNVFYDLRHTDMTLGIDASTDAYIGGAGWSPYYFTAPFVVLSRLASDLYLKTAILRVPFALMGVAGLLLLLRTGLRTFEKRLSSLALALLFVVLELPSVTLMLHLREVRYYSLQLLCTAVALTVFAAYHLHASIRYRSYAVAVIALIPLLFLTFYPAAAAFCMAVCLYAGGDWVVAALNKRFEGIPLNRHWASFPFKTVLPVFASLALLIPMAWFFKTLSISQQLDEFYGYTISTFLEHLAVLLGYFMRYDILLFAIAAKSILITLRERVKNDVALLPPFRLSLFLSLYAILHALLVCKIPNEFFIRYFITLQPILVLTFAIDLLIIARLSFGMRTRQRIASLAVVATLTAGSAGWAFFQNRQFISGRLYEISHQYRGVLDFVIPYIQKRFKRPDQLVIATNYEETSYIFYLNCKVIIGFVNPDLEPDRLEQPDCIMYRTFWKNSDIAPLFDRLRKQANYEKVQFPVRDYGFNNIPETEHWTPRTGWSGNLHLFRTTYATDPKEQSTLYIRSGSATTGSSVPANRRETP